MQVEVESEKMPLSALNLTRVSFTQQTDSMLDSLRRQSTQLLRGQNQLATGQAFNVPSEDPAKAAQVLNLAGALGRQGQVLENLRHATSFLDVTDNAVIEIAQLLADAHAISSQNVGSLVSSEEREAAAELIADIVEQMVTVGNRQFNDVFIFGGRDTKNAPFVDAEGGIAFVGDTGDIFAKVSLLDQESINLTGDQLFGALASSVRGTIDLSPQLTSDSRLDEIVNADGESIGLGQLVIARAGDADRFEVDLSAADTLGDIVNAINEVAGTVVTAALSDTGIMLTPTGGAITVTDTSTGRIARDLGLLSDQATTGQIDSVLTRRVTRTTRIADLADGAGIDLSGGLLITNGGKSVEIDLSTAETAQDVLNEINNAGLGVRALINAAGNGIDILNQVSGSNLSIAENGGTTAAELGLRSLDATTRLSTLNFGAGVEFEEGRDDLQITGKDGSSVDINLDGAQTIGDVVDLINTAAADAGVSVTAELTSVGNGIRIVDGTSGSGVLSVSRLNLSFAIDDLGLSVQVSDPADTELSGQDVSAVRTDSVLTALLDLEEALRNDDTQEITDAGTRVSGFIEQVTRVQGLVGARAKAMQNRQSQTDAAIFSTQKLMSEIQDLDYAEAVTVFQQAQTALQATLSTGTTSLNLSLINFL